MQPQLCSLVRFVRGGIMPRGGSPLFFIPHPGGISKVLPSPGKRGGLGAGGFATNSGTLAPVGFSSCNFFAGRRLLYPGPGSAPDPASCQFLVKMQPMPGPSPGSVQGRAGIHLVKNYSQGEVWERGRGQGRCFPACENPWLPLPQPSAGSPSGGLPDLAPCFRGGTPAGGRT
jgi:hypothetical protein